MQSDVWITGLRPNSMATERLAPEISGDAESQPGQHHYQCGDAEHLGDEVAGDGASCPGGLAGPGRLIRMSLYLASSAVGFSAVRLPRASVQAESMAASLRS